MDRKLVQRMISLIFAVTFLGVLFAGSDLSESETGFKAGSVP